jgi:hypothetical protein
MALILSGVMVVSGLVTLTGVRRLTAHAGFRTPDEHTHSTLSDIAIAWCDRDIRAGRTHGRGVRDPAALDTRPRAMNVGRPGTRWGRCSIRPHRTTEPVQKG